MDVVFEHVGKATWEKSIRALVKGERLVTFGATSGHDPILDLRHVFFRELRIFGNFMGPRAGLKRACSSSRRSSDPSLTPVFLYPKRLKRRKGSKSENSLVKSF